MDSHCTRYHYEQPLKSAARRARREVSSARPVTSLMPRGVLAASQYQQFLTQSIEQPLPIQHHPQQLRVQSSSCRAIEHRDNRTAAINQRPVAIPASFETGMVPQEQSAARASAHPSARSNMSSPPHDRSTYDATSVFSMPVPEPYSSSSTCTARSQGSDLHRSRCERVNP